MLDAIKHITDYNFFSFRKIVCRCIVCVCEWNMWFLCFCVLPGSAKAQVIWGGIVKRLLIAYFMGNISAKKSKSIHVRQSYSKPKVGRLLRYGVVRNLDLLPMICTNYFVKINWYRTKNTTYVIRFLLQICQVYFSDFTKPIFTDRFRCSGTKILIKSSYCKICNLQRIASTYCEAV